MEPRPDQGQEVFLRKSKVWVPYLFTIVAGLLLCASNAQQKEVPLFFVAGLILLEYLRRDLL
jgi:hypothetical protein